MPDLETTVLLFVAGCISWTISIFSGGGGSIVLLAAVTHLIRVKTIAPVITIASLMASPTRILGLVGGLSSGQSSAGIFPARFAVQSLEAGFLHTPMPFGSK